MGSTLDYHDWIELPADLDTDWHEQLRTNWEDIEPRLLKVGTLSDRPSSAPDGALFLRTDTSDKKIYQYNDSSGSWETIGDLWEITPGFGLSLSSGLKNGGESTFDVSPTQFAGDGLTENASNELVPDTADEGTVTATGGADPAVDTTITTSLNETEAYDFILYVDSDPPWDGAYRFNWNYSHYFDYAPFGDSETKIDLTVNWDTDPGNGNDLTLRYEVIRR